MAGQHFGVERHDSWPKTTEALRTIAHSIGWLIMMGQVLVEKQLGRHPKRTK